MVLTLGLDTDTRRHWSDRQWNWRDNACPDRMPVPASVVADVAALLKIVHHYAGLKAMLECFDIFTDGQTDDT